jgi:hypothetical protein
MVRFLAQTRAGAARSEDLSASHLAERGEVSATELAQRFTLTSTILHDHMTAHSLLPQQVCHLQNPDNATGTTT